MATHNELEAMDKLQRAIYAIEQEHPYLAMHLMDEAKEFLTLDFGTHAQTFQSPTQRNAYRRDKIDDPND